MALIYIDFKLRKSTKITWKFPGHCCFPDSPPRTHVVSPDRRVEAALKIGAYPVTHVVWVCGIPVGSRADSSFLDFFVSYFISSLERENLPFERLA